MGVEQRPFRIGVAILTPNLDKMKPLATANYSGWVINGDIMVGAVSNDWIAAISVTTKEVRWWLKTPTPLAAPTVSIGNWFVFGMRDGKVLKVEATTGKTVWEAGLDSFSPRPATLYGSTLLILTSGQQLYALDFQTGATQWLYDGGFPDGLMLEGAPSPVVQNDKVIIGLASGEVQAVSLVTGKLLWEFEPDYNEARFHDVMGEIVVKGNQLLITRYDGLVAGVDVGETERTIAWKETVASITTSSFRNGRLYVGCINGDIYAYEAATGRRIWRTQTGKAVSTITAGENSIYVSGTDGRVNAVNALTGDVLWYDDLAGEIVRKPVLFQEGIFFATGLNNLYGYKID